MQDKRKELIYKLTGITDFSKESLEAERIKTQNELEELNPKIKEDREEFERLHGNKPIEEQIKIALNSAYEESFDLFKSIYFVNLKVSTSLINVAKYYDTFKLHLKNLLASAGFVSIKTKLETIREVKSNFLMSLGEAEQLIGLERNGVYENPKPSTFVQTKKGIEGLVQRVEELGKNMREPLIVARANKRVYEDIITLLDREEEMVLIELRNGKSLDYTPMDDKKDNGNPTTSATVKEKKSHKKPYSSKVILEVIEKVNESEGVLPKNLSGKAMFKEYAKIIKSIFGDEFDYDAGTLANNHKLPLDSTEQGQVFDILKQYGYDDLANQYRLKDRIRD